MCPLLPGSLFCVPCLLIVHCLAFFITARSRLLLLLLNCLCGWGFFVVFFCGFFPPWAWSLFLSHTVSWELYRFLAHYVWAQDTGGEITRCLVCTVASSAVRFFQAYIFSVTREDGLFAEEIMSKLFFAHMSLLCPPVPQCLSSAYLKYFCNYQDHQTCSWDDTQDTVLMELWNEGLEKANHIFPAAESCKSDLFLYLGEQTVEGCYSCCSMVNQLPHHPTNPNPISQLFKNSKYRH